MTQPAPDLVRVLAPTGRLRTAINLGNPVLAQGTPEAPRGTTVDLAHELGRRLGVAVDLVPFPTAGKVFEANKTGALDLMFLAIEPVRAAEIDFTDPYVLIEGVFMVRADSPLRSAAEADRSGVRIAVTRGSAYDLYLSRTLKHATLERSDNGIAAFMRDALDVVGGVKQPLAAYAAAHPGLRLLDGRFMQIRQALGLPKGRGAAALAYLAGFIAEMKASGFVAAALKRSGQDADLVARD